MEVAMKAIAVYPDQREVKLIDHPAPSLSSPTDVKLRMIEVGICGTDKEICAFEYGTPPDGSDYLVIGHESLGEVVEVGSGVKRLKRGDLVVPMVRRPCPHPECLACREDRQDFCYTGDFTERGIKQRHGYMTEFIVDDEKYMNPVPTELREVAVLVEPLTIAEKGLTQLWQVQQRLPWACPIEPDKPAAFCHRAVVLGAGPVGLLGAMTLMNQGFQTFVYSQESKTGTKSTVTASIGATYVSGQNASLEQLAALVGNIDLVYEATGAATVSFQLMELLGTNGVFIFTGVPGRKAPIELDADLIMRNLVLKNQIVYGTVNANREAFQSAISDLQVFVKKWPEAVRTLITQRYPMEQYRDLLLGKPGGIKNVISIG
jgi:threonine dehydrogenase-like Zn-dependent dehydrogenase